MSLSADHFALSPCFLSFFLFSALLLSFLFRYVRANIAFPLQHQRVILQRVHLIFPKRLDLPASCRRTFMWCTFLRQMLVEVPNSLPLISRSDVCYILISLFWQCRHLMPRCSEAAWDKSRICCWQTSALHVNRKDCFAFIVGGNTTLSRICIFLSKKKTKFSTRLFRRK